MSTGNAVRQMRVRSEVTTGVGWDAGGGPDSTGITLADDDREFANAQHPLTKVIVQCSGQVLARVQVQGAKKKFSLRMQQTLTGTIGSARSIRLDGMVPAGQTDFCCSLPYSYTIAVPLSQYSNFRSPAQPSIDIVDRIDNGARITVVEAEDLGQVTVTYRFSAP